LNLYQTEYIIAGAIPVIIMAILVDLVFSAIEKKVVPKGMKGIKSV